jgi:tetratricopeptide (TPR) repeat protein
MRDPVVLAVARARAGSFDEAEQMLRERLREAPADAEATVALGMVLSQTGRHAAALEMVRRQDGAERRSEESYIVEGRALRALGRLDESARAFQEGCACHPRSAELQFGAAGVARDRGDFATAIQAARAALSLKPALAEASYSLGVSLLATGDVAGAVTALEGAVRLRPQLAEGWLALADARVRLSDTQAARAALEKAVVLRPELGAAMRGQALAAQAADDHEFAAVLLYRASLLHPDDAALLEGLAQVLHAAGRLEEAARAYRSAASCSSSAWLVWSNLGTVCCDLGRFEEAEQAYGRATAERPDFADGHFNLGNLLRRLPGRGRDAVAALRQAIRLRPEDAETAFLLGATLRELLELEEAGEWMRRAIELDPAKLEYRIDYGTLLSETGSHDAALAQVGETARSHADSVDAAANYATMLYYCGRADESIGWFDRALLLDPSHVNARLGRSIAQLMLGEFESGWPAFESRFDAMPVDALHREGVRLPRWRGEPLEGRRLLLMHEQGLGDSLQFVRYALQLAEEGAEVSIEAPAPLVRLYRRLPGLRHVVESGRPYPPLDVSCPIMSVPACLGSRWRLALERERYLEADTARVQTWRQRLGAARGLRVGLVWSGDPRPEDRAASLTNRRRSIVLDRVAPLLSVEGVSFVSLQKGGPGRQLASVAAAAAVIDWTTELTDFAETAALVQALDLVISVDTSVAHLAGALGKPVWLLSRSDGCWRWMLGRDDSPWYPSLRVFRQARALRWEPVIEDVAAELARVVAGGPLLPWRERGIA